MLEWPIARLNSQSTRIQDPPTEIFLEEYRNDSPLLKNGSFKELHKTLLNSYKHNLPPTEALSELVELSGLIRTGNEKRSIIELSDIALVLACVSFIHKQPKTKVWRYLWSLANHSGELARDLPRVIVGVAQKDNSFKSALLKIASTVIKENAANPAQSTHDRDGMLRHQLIAAWNREPRLIDLWWGLRGSESISFRDDSDGMYSIASELDPQAFISILSSLDNPYSVRAAMYLARAASSFERWLTFFSISPTAFDTEGSWTGSTIAPLLLTIAQEQLKLIRIDREAPDQENAINVADVELHTLARQIAQAVHHRVDAAPCAKRWSVWLMRQSISAIAGGTIPYPTNLKSPGYSDLILIQELGNELQNCDWKPPHAARDIEPWEHWAYRCVLVSLRHMGCNAPVPDLNDFLTEWSVKSGDWPSVPGENLRSRSSIFRTFGNRPDAYGTRMLAAALAQAEEPSKTYAELWRATVAIREIIEYGDPDEITSDNLRGDMVASQLMRLLFGIGLMMLDYLVDNGASVSYDRKKSLTSLLEQLFDCYREMRAIDWLNSTYWTEALRHLAVRRALWTADKKNLAAWWDDDTKPDLLEFIYSLSNDVENLLAFLEVAIRNGLKTTQLQTALGLIDFPDQLDYAVRLFDLNPTKVNISKQQIEIAQTLIPKA
jgi:hypothetical protein